ncbi:MAG: polyhydroxyalkanoic acid system family protein, partial [Propionivibrio sp.]|nr:polyhydroxyalkanoic acid system family protein [Propionivibrio sp.]
MDDIVIYRKHGKTLAEARKSAERMAAELNEEFELNCAWQGNVLTFERLGVSGKLELDDQEVGVIVNLSFLLTALK